MATEYRLIMKATFNTAEEREKAFLAIKNAANNLKNNALFKRADLIRDEYEIPDAEGVQII
jgi:hypothetical protein